MVEQIHETIIAADANFSKVVGSKRAFQDSYNYLRDRYNLKSSYSTFEKNNINKGFLHDDEDFDLIVVSVLVGMGRIQDAYEEANVQSDSYIKELEDELEQVNDELSERVTTFVQFQDMDFNEASDQLVKKLKEFNKSLGGKQTFKKLTLWEKTKLAGIALIEAFENTFKKGKK